MVSSKVCTKCGEERNLDEFYKRKTAKDGLTNHCKYCIRKKNKAWNIDYYRNKGGKQKEQWRKRYGNYGVDQDSFETVLKAQNNKCKICGLEFDNKTKLTTPHIDHDHKTGTFRGLLCDLCNKGLGHFKDDTDILEEAIKYLKENDV